MEIILAAVVSLLTQIVKKWAGTKEYLTLAVVIALSLAVAGIYQLAVYTGYWEMVANILILAGAIYTFIIRRFEK